MVFSSIVFLFYFLPALLLLYYLTPCRLRSVRNAVLLLFSLAFYAFGGPKALLLMLISITVNYLGGLFAGEHYPRAVRRLALILSVAIGIGLLGVFKYLGFFAQTLNTFGLPLTVPKITLPIGISFFTFQGLSYVIDVYRGDAKTQKNPFLVALYISLFPQLVAGPIVRYTTVENELAVRTESAQETSDGIVRFLIGLGKKMLLANAMGEMADAIFGQSGALSAGTAWLGALAYTAQIYFDFSAYSDMAIGLGHMFGFHFPENFNYPYIATSVTDFWRRWHITLSTWFRDYVYIPLGGNRCPPARHILNLLVVWSLTGLWHGASWNFVLWGILFFVFLVGEKYIFGRLLQKLPHVFGWLYTMLIVVLSWVLFRSATLSDAVRYIGYMFGVGAGATRGEALYYLLEYWPELLLCVIGSLPFVPFFKQKLATHQTPFNRFILSVFPKIAALVIFALSYIKLSCGSFNPFIYFRF